ncbi:hypothetical protein MRB53_038638 [Persea americana]|nr:hypothetical protein MRB53_038638 [Persea americana]
MVGSKDLKPSTKSFFPNVFYDNQFRAKPQWPLPQTSLQGMTAIVTGASSGLGYEAARQLLDLGLTNLIIAVRSPSKGEAAASQLKVGHARANIEVSDLDMSSYTSVLNFAKRVEAIPNRIDVVVLNAGVARLNFNAIKETGHEECLQVNYLSTMLLTMLLIPKLRSQSGPPPHITIVNAALTLAAKFPNKDAVPLLPNLDLAGSFDSAETYNTSKLLAHMFLWKLVDYVSCDDVIINLADPGWVKGTDPRTGCHRRNEGGDQSIRSPRQDSARRSIMHRRRCGEQAERVARLLLDELARPPLEDISDKDRKSYDGVLLFPNRSYVAPTLCDILLACIVCTSTLCTSYVLRHVLRQCWNDNNRNVEYGHRAFHPQSPGDFV